MSVTLTGTATAADRAAPSTTAPVDGEANSAASLNDQIQECLDQIASLKAAVAYLTGHSTNTTAFLVAPASGNTNAITGTGKGTGAGGVFAGEGGANIAPGLTSTGSNSGAGAVLTGGGNAGNGATVTGGGAHGTGMVVTGGASNGRGMTVAGDGTGIGIHVTGGDSSGTGLEAYGGAANGRGATIKGYGTENGLLVEHDGGTAFNVARFNGRVHIASDNPAASVSLTNRLCSKNIPKAFGHVVTDGAGAFSNETGLNFVASIPAADTIRITLGGDMANTTYVVLPMMDPAGALLPNEMIVVSAKATTHFDVKVYDVPGTAYVNITTSVRGVSFLVFGEQS